MTGQMCWLPILGTHGENILHLRFSPHQPWQPYTAFSNYSVPDYKVPGGSRGWATYQKLMRSGWTLVNSSQAKQVPVSAKIEAKV
jgi:hypothetical protein